MSENNLRSLASMLVIPVRVVAFAAVLLFLVQAGEAQAYGGSFSASSEVTLSDYDACAPADITSIFHVAEGNMNFQVNVTFTPEEWVMADPDLPIGAVTGQLNSEATVGLFGQPCNQQLKPKFTMYNATVDTSDELPRAEPPYEPQDSVVDDPDDPSAYPAPGAEHYPEWLNDAKLFQGLQPIARSIGVDVNTVPGTIIALQFLVFEPGTCLPDAPCPPPAGYPSVTVLQDPTTVAPSGITDFCSSLHSENVTYGLSLDNPATAENEGGYVVRRNPIEGGTYTFATYARSYYNSDDDDYENYLDTCPYDVNVEDPTLTDGPDHDGFDSACDPEPAVTSPTAGMNCGGAGLPDYDQDCYPDPGDNCPEVANGIDNDGNIIGDDNQADADKDYIGDACDNNPNSPDGWALDTTEETPISINEVADCDGDGMDSTYELEHDCLDPLVDDADDDADDDGVSNIDEMDAGTDPCVREEVADTDGDGVNDSVELSYNSDPDDSEVTPEDMGFDEEFDAETCTDGLDNDKDEKTDAADPGCVSGETILTEDASTGDTEVEVESTTGFENGDAIEIGTGDTKEANTISEITGGSIGTFTLATALEFDHEEGEPVVKAEAVAVTPTPTPTAEEGAPAPGVTPTPTPEVEVEFCQPVIPGTYNGRVLVDGAPARSGYQVTASIDDIVWGSAIVSGGRYAMDIPDHLPAEPPCFAGGTIVFELNGMTCTPVEDGADEWAAGIQNVDLACVPVVPEVTPTPTPPATPTPTPTPTVTPVSPPPTGAGGLAGSTAGLPLWAMALAGWAGLMSIAGVGTLVAAKRR